MNSTERNMPVLKYFPAPTEGLHYVQPNISVFSGSECFGKGTLYVCESTLCWISTSGKGLSLPYPFFGCIGNEESSRILLKYTGRIVLVEDPNELPNADEEEEEVDNDIRFVPDDLNVDEEREALEEGYDDE